MATIKLEKNQNHVYNEAGMQLVGNAAYNTDGGLNPKEMVEGAIGLCILLNMRSILERDEFLTEETSISIDVTCEKDQEQNRFSKYTVKIKMPEDMDEAYQKKVLISAERACTISHTIEAAAEIVTELI